MLKYYFATFVQQLILTLIISNKVE